MTPFIPNDRRTFLKTSGLAAAAASMPSILRAQEAKAGGDIKIALVGCGGRGTGAASQSLNTGGTRLVAIADAFPDNAQRAYDTLKKQFGDKVDVPKERIYSGFDAYKAAIDACDLVILTTPPGFRPAHFEYAVEKGKHVFLEKPIAVEIHEADELIAIARRKGVKFTIGYSQRFNPKYAYVKKCLDNGAIGKPVSAMVSRHIQRSLGAKITGRSKLSPAAMEATHDLDFILWCLAPAKPIRVYSQANYGVMRANSGKDVPDTQWITVTMDSGMSFVVGAGWSLPPGYPNACSTWIEMIGTDGALMIDDTHRDVMLNTMKSGMQMPMSSMVEAPKPTVAMSRVRPNWFAPSMLIFARVLVSGYSGLLA